LLFFCGHYGVDQFKPVDDLPSRSNRVIHRPAMRGMPLPAPGVLVMFAS
jgi:hypothetical protein